MSTRTYDVGRRGPYLGADLDAMPDDGNRYEILDGVLLVNPAPGTAHQLAVPRLWSAIHDGIVDASPSSRRTDPGIKRDRAGG